MSQLQFEGTVSSNANAVKLSHKDTGKKILISQTGLGVHERLKTMEPHIVNTNLDTASIKYLAAHTLYVAGKLKVEAIVK